ncbi:MAG: TIGR02757 family protein [Desulfobacter sp.]|nr:MAG: TIGR02757 family protein [Desulfobacter sp.]
MPGKQKDKKFKQKLDTLYERYTKRAFVDPDPLLFLYDYPEIQDREIVGMVASCLAYGRVGMIMKTVGHVLAELGDSPHRFLTRSSLDQIQNRFRGFKYRFATEAHLCSLFSGIQNILKTHGSLEGCFLSAPTSAGPVQGLTAMYQTILESGDPGHLLADPRKNSACKRSFLFLRWMVRKDEVDPGGWSTLSPSELVYPIDTHIYKIGTLMGFTQKKAANKGCALEITRGFRQIEPHDPVKYDFALTRFGIRDQMDLKDLSRYLLSGIP